MASSLRAKKIQNNCYFDRWKIGNYIHEGKKQTNYTKNEAKKIVSNSSTRSNRGESNIVSQYYSTTSILHFGGTNTIFVIPVDFVAEQNLRHLVSSSRF